MKCFVSSPPYLPGSYRALFSIQYKRSSFFTKLGYPRTAKYSTSDYAPKQRKAFAKLSEEDVNYFKTFLPNIDVVQDKSELDSFNHDWMKKFRGTSSLALRPHNTEHVSKILAYCNSKGLAVVPQGGNTGLVGGSVPVFDEIVLSTSKMNQILSFDEDNAVVVTEAGVVLESLDEYLQGKGFTVPLDLGAKGSCQIGGNVATNACGIRLLRYGSLHGNVMGLEAVLADGTIVNNLNTLRKDNTGYDIKQLFIGSEGTLGVITKVALLSPTKSKAVNAAFLGCNSYQDVLGTLATAKACLGEILSAFEFMDSATVELVREQFKPRFPFGEEKYPFYVLVETSGSNSQHDGEKLDTFLENSLHSGCIANGAVAQDTTQFRDFWFLRESIAEALMKAGTGYKYDVSIPQGCLYQVVDEMRAKLSGKGNVIGYGHVGDGNLHLNVSVPKLSDDVLHILEPFIYEWTTSKKGSISAEHGIGLMKASKLGYSKTDECIEVMKKLKAVLDPKGILNPYKVIPSDT